MAIGALMVVALFVTDAMRFAGTMARLDRVAATTADLVARSDSLVDEVDFNAPTRNDSLATFFFAGNEVAEPDDLVLDGRIILSSVRPSGGGSFDRNWERTGPYGLPAASRLTLLPELPTTGSFIVSEVFFRFRPLILERLGLLDEASVVLYARAFFRPRTGSLEVLEPAGS